MEPPIKIIDDSAHLPAGYDIQCPNGICKRLATYSLQVEIFGEPWQLWSCGPDKLALDVQIAEFESATKAAAE